MSGPYADSLAISFRRGARVRHKSGGPVLLVVGHSPDRVHVEWFTADGEVRRHSFAQDEVEAAP